MLSRISLCVLTGAALVANAVVARAQTLDSIARVAIANNLGVRRTGERQRQADAGISQARGLFLPSVGIDARYSRMSGEVNIGDFINPAYATLNQLTGKNAFPTNVDATLPLQQETKLHTAVPVYNAALFANLDAAHATRTLRGAERAAAIRRLDATARIAYLDWARAARAVQIWEATMPVLVEHVRVSQCLVDAGSATPDAVLRARADLADMQQQRAEAVRTRDAALGALNLLLDRAPDEPVPALSEDALPVAPTITLADALAASARREEREIAVAAVDGARAAGRAASSGFLPSVAVAVDYGVQGNGYHFDRGHDVAIASVVLQWNLFNGGQDGARREAASAARVDADLQRADVDRQISLDVRTAWDAARVAREAVEAASARLAAARLAFKLVDRRYTEGLTSRLEWSDARAQLTAAELNEVVTRYSLAAHGIELERAASLRTIPKN
jgi:outer membrane protein TolC